MSKNHLELGRNSEKMAVRFLKKQGYRILETNYRNSCGEIDIVARYGDTITFVEVKARSSLRFGAPKSAVTEKKQRKLSMVALGYLKEKGKTGNRARFDVVSILFGQNSKKPEIELVENAFELAYG
jgi:putative endonuclease